MTETTDSRQIRLLISGILSKYEIDNLQLEIDLASAAKRYMDERRKDKDKASVRARILMDMDIATAKASRNEAMESRIFKATGLYVNERWYKDGIMSFLINQDELGKTIEKFAETCKANPYTMPKFFKIAERPQLLRDTWGLVFSAQSDPEEYHPEYKKFVPEDEGVQYAPPPATRPRILRRTD